MKIEESMKDLGNLRRLTKIRIVQRRAHHLRNDFKIDPVMKSYPSSISKLFDTQSLDSGSFYIASS
jgi:hypothetical protein